MNRTQIYLTSRQIKVLKQIAEQKDISMSELIRRLLDKYIDEKVNITNLK